MSSKSGQDHMPLDPIKTTLPNHGYTVEVVGCTDHGNISTHIRKEAEVILTYPLGIPIPQVNPIITSAVGSTKSKITSGTKIFCIVNKDGTKYVGGQSGSAVVKKGTNKVLGILSFASAPGVAPITFQERGLTYNVDV